MPSRPSDLIRGALVGAATSPGDWFLIEHAGGLYRISRAELLAALTGGPIVVGGNLRVMAAGVGASVVIGNGFVETQIVSARDSPSDHGMLDFYSSRGTTSAPTALQNGDRSMTIGSAAFDGATYVTNAQIVAQINGTVGPGSVPTAMVLAVAPVGFAAPLGSLILRPEGSVEFSRITTTASASNAFIDSGNGNSLLRSTSSLAYKRDIEDLDSALADAVVDQARPVWYRSNSDHDRQDWSWIGLVAEELAEIQPRLVTYGYRDEHYEMVEVEPAEEGNSAHFERRVKSGAVKVPDGVAYDRLTVVLLDVLRRERAKVAALQEALSELTVRVEALEA